MALSDKQISKMWSDAHYDTSDRMAHQVLAKAIEAEVHKQDTELIRQMLEALELLTDGYDGNAVGLEVEAITAARAWLDGAAPQQEAQKPVAWESTTPGFIKYITQARYEKFSPNVRRWYKPYKCSSCTAPQPAPAPLSEMPYEKRKAIQEGEQIGASDAWFKARHEMLDTVDRRNVFRAGFDRGWSAALAAQGGKCPMRIEP